MAIENLLRDLEKSDANKRTVVVLYGLLAVLIAAGFVSHRMSARAYESRQQRRAAMLATPIAELRQDQSTFGETIDRLSRSTGVSITLDSKELEAAGVDRSARVLPLVLFELPLVEVLDITLQQVGGQTKLAWMWQGDGILITTAETGANHAVAVQVYDVRDIAVPAWPSPAYTPSNICFSNNAGNGSGRLFGNPGPAVDIVDEPTDTLIRLISATIAPESWRDAGGTVGMIRGFDRRLIVTQTPENHQQIARLLERLRTSTGEEWPVSLD